MHTIQILLDIISRKSQFKLFIYLIDGQLMVVTFGQTDIECQVLVLLLSTHFMTLLPRQENNFALFCVKSEKINPFHFMDQNSSAGVGR